MSSGVPWEQVERTRGFCYDAWSVARFVPTFTPQSLLGGSRVSEVNPADLPSAGGRVLAEEFPNESSEFIQEPETPKASKFVSEIDTPKASKSEREGLPAGYRMRADSHYVEQLTARRGERAERVVGDGARVPRKPDPVEADPPSAEPRDRRDPRDRRTERLLAQMTEDLASIESSAAMLAAETSVVARRVSVDLVRSHAWRAAFLVKAAALLDNGPRGAIRPRPLSTLLQHVRDGFAPECRLTTFGLHVHAPDWNALVSVDEPAVVLALTGAVIATLGILGPPEGSTIKLSAAASAGELRVVEVTQDEASLPAGVTQRIFDPTWTDRPGGWTAAIGAAVARAVAQHHGGEAALVAAGKRGTTLRLSFTRA